MTSQLMKKSFASIPGFKEDFETNGCKMYKGYLINPDDASMFSSESEVDNYINQVIQDFDINELINQSH